MSGRALVGCLCVLVFVPSMWAQQEQAGKVQEIATYGKLPMRFEQNIGQSDSQVQFLSRGNGYAVFFTPQSTVFRFRPKPQQTPGQAQISKGELAKQIVRPLTPPDVVGMNLLGVSATAMVAGQNALDGSTNYLVGNDANKWRKSVPTFAQVQYTNIYPGIDLVYYGNQQQLEYDFVVRPGADPRTIAFGFQGNKSISIDESGNLSIVLNNGVVTINKPLFYQVTNGQREAITGAFVLSGNQAGISVGTYDPSVPLIVDPVVSYSTYLGGTGDDYIYSIAADASGNAYVAGFTDSADFPTVGTPITSGPASGDVVAFVSKLNAAGSDLEYSTYLGGTGGFDGAWGIAVDASGRAYVAGATDSADFPITSSNAYETSLGSGASENVFLAKLSADGQSLLYSTYLGGSGSDWGLGVAVDASENAYVTGVISSSNFPITSSAFQSTLHSTIDNAFLARIDTTQSGSSSLVYSTFLGGSTEEEGDGIAIDANHNAYIVGVTFSTDFPTTSQAYQPTATEPTGSTGGELYLTQIDTTQSGSASLIYSTLLAGTIGGIGEGNSVAVDATNKVYVTGITGDSDFPTTTGSASPASDSNLQVIVAKFDTSKSGSQSLIYSTVFGGSGLDDPSAITVDGNGNAYIGGYTQSTDFPVTSDAAQTTLGSNGQNPFVAVLKPDASSLLYSTYLGGSGSSDYGDSVYGLALDPNYNLYVAGTTFSSGFPTSISAFQTILQGPSDGFIVKLTALSIPRITSLSSSSGVIGSTLTITGLNFGSTQGTSTVKFASTTASISSWSDTSIVAVVPTVTPGVVPVTVNTSVEPSNPASFSVLVVISSLSASTGAVGLHVTISGSDFGASQSASTVTFNGTAATPTSWSATQIVVPVPSGATTGNIVATVSGVASNGATFTVVPYALSSITVSPVNPSITTGTSQQFIATGSYTDGTTQNLSGSASWTSGSTGVATIASGGLASAVAVGETIIQATVSSISGSTVLGVVSLVSTGSMTSDRQGQTATLLNNATVLMTGGYDDSGNPLSSAEIFDPSSGTFTATGSMTSARTCHTATLLNNGAVLVAGGYDSGGNPLSSAEIFDPSAGTFSATGSLSNVRACQTATLLNDGTVLIAGGYDSSSSPLADAELFNPATGTFTGIGSMAAARVLNSATLLNDGAVLIAGGYDSTGSSLASAEVFDPSSRSFAATGSLNIARGGHTATLLNGGKVLVAGGMNGGNPVAGAELYDPTAGTFTATGNLSTARAYQTATLLNDGGVLIAGGYDSNSSSLASLERYSAPTGTFTGTGNMAAARVSQTATLLNSGKVLIAGGIDGDFATVASAELYQPSGLIPPALVSIALTPSSPSISVAVAQLFTATGTFSDSSTQALSSVTWSSSDNTKAALTDDGTNRGHAFGLASGSTTVSACTGSICGTAALAVTAVGVAITELSPSAGPVGSTVIIAGTGFGSTQGSSTVTFNGTTATIGLWSATGIVATVPTGATTGNVLVTVSSTNSNGVTFTVGSAPAISGLSPVSGSSGTLVTLTGSTFGAARGVAVTFNGTEATIGTWSDTSITAYVPAGATTGNVVVTTAGGAVSNGSSFTVPNIITGLSPNAGPAGTSVSIIGTGFGAAQGTNSVAFNGTSASVGTWSATSIVVTVPSGATTGNLVVTVSGTGSNGVPFTVLPAVTSLSPTFGPSGTSVTITGSTFGSTQGSSSVSFNAVPASVTSWSATSITVTVPSGATTGNVIVNEGVANSNGLSFTVTTGSSWPNGYAYQRAITIDHTKVPNTDQTNFPILFSGTYSYLATTSNGGNVTNVNGYDIIFASDASGTNILPFECESYDPSTGAVNCWVKIPTVSHTSDTVFYMFYGNSSVTTDQSNKTAVWDSNYKGVWHLNEASGTTNYDSTVDNISASKQSASSPSPAAGLFGGVQSFNGSTDYETIANTSAIDVGGGNHTVSVWFNANLYSNYGTLFTKEENPAGGSNRDYSFWINSTSDGWWAAGNTGGSNWSYSGFSTGTWHYLVMARSGSTETAYLDGSSIFTQSFSGTTDSGGDVEIGADHLFSGNYWNGLLGELRVSNSLRSADWIATEYNNQSSSSTFYAVSSVGSLGPSITSISPTSGGISTSVTITGTTFGSTQGSSTVTFNGTAGTSTSWSATSITAAVPVGATTGSVRVALAGVASNGISFTVTAPSLISIAVTPASPGIDNGTAQQLIATGSYSDGSAQDVSSIATWSSSATAVATINSTGLASAVASGQSTIQASLSSINGSTVLTVSAFSLGGSLNTARRDHTATLLNNGKVLIAGGYDTNGNVLTSAELYDTTAGTFAATGNLNAARRNQSATLLNSGKVLLAGGYGTSGSALTSAEIFDPATGFFTATGNLGTARGNHTATLLSNGEVLVAGGYDASGNALASAELYDPAATTFATTGNLNTARDNHTATLLNTGKVLIAGGYDSSGTILGSAELYDPSAGTFSFTGSLNSVRASHTSILLNTGKVLLVGGISLVHSGRFFVTTAITGAELFDPAGGTFSSTGSMTTARASQTVTLLNNGTVLVAGGQDTNSNLFASAEIYDPVAGTFASANSMSTMRVNDTVTLLTNGAAFVAGGMSSTSTVLASTELYQPISLTPAGLISIAVSPSTPSVSVGGAQLFTATGTFSDSSTQVLSSVTWSSSDNTKATLSNDWSNHGNGFGVASGSATVNACAGSVCGSASMTVTSSSLGLTSLSPTSGAAGTVVSIVGTGFGTSQGSSAVTFNGTAATAVANWSATEIVVAVPSGATTGNVVVTVSGTNSNGVSFTIVPAPVITGLSPALGASGTSVTISGSNFGGTQGGSIVTFGGISASITSWSDTSIVASVPTDAITANVVVTSPAGLTSNGLTFTVPLIITNLSPTSGALGTLVTITGSSFGTAQGTSTAAIGGTPLIVISWSDTQIVGAVASGTTTSATSVQEGTNVASGPTFTVTSTFPYSVSPQSLSLLVGESRTITVTGIPLTQILWRTSNPAVVSLSADDPPLVTGIAPGYATVYAGAVPISVTVYAGSALPSGTAIWSIPLGGSNEVSLVPAVPSSSGVDVFALGGESLSTLSALSGDGTVVWQAAGIGEAVSMSGYNISLSSIIPDFSGNALLKSFYEYIDGSGYHGTHTVQQVNSATGATTTLYTFSSQLVSSSYYDDNSAVQVVIPDTTGVLFIQDNATVSLFNLSTKVQIGTSITLDTYTENLLTGTVTQPPNLGHMIVAGDGNAYVPYVYGEITESSDGMYTTTYDETQHLMVLRVSPDGTNAKIQLNELTSETIHSSDISFSGSKYAFSSNSEDPSHLSVVTNAGLGAAVMAPPTICSDCSPQELITFISHDVITSQVNVTLDGFLPKLQREDGSYIGTDGYGYIAAVSSDGGVLWRKSVTPVAPGDSSPFPRVSPQYAISDGGVIVTSTQPACPSGNIGFPDDGSTDLLCQDRENEDDGTIVLPYSPVGQLGTLYTLDQNGNITSQTPDTGAVYSWTNNWYSDAPGIISNVSESPVTLAGTFATGPGGNLSRQGTAIQQVQTNQAQGSDVQLPPDGATLDTTYNSIELLTSQSPDQIFNQYIQTFAGLQNAKHLNDVARVPDGTDVTAICQKITFTLQGVIGSRPLVWLKVGQGPFSVGVKQFNTQPDTISVVTLKGHPLAGWRYWRVFSIGPNDLVIETGSADTNGPGPLNYAGHYFFGFLQRKVWKEDFQYILSDLRSKGLGQQGSNPGYNIVNGVKPYNETYILEHIGQSLPNSCGY